MTTAQLDYLADPLVQMTLQAGVELVAIFFAVIAAFLVEERRTRRLERKRAVRIYAALKSELAYYVGLTEQIAERIESGLAAWQSDFDRGKRPSPFYHRVEGAERPPQAAWQAALRSNILAVFDPELVIEVGNFYHEIDGVGLRYIRYDSFVESEILPLIEAGQDGFYRDKRLLPKFRANMDRLAELGAYHTKFASWASQISERIDEQIRRLEGGRSH